jgi:hypothetical protein
MPKAVSAAPETMRVIFDPTTFKAFLRDLLFRETGKPYFKRLLLPRRRYRLLGAWQTLSVLQAERQLLPVGKRNTDTLIRQFFTDHTCLRAEFQEGGMPTSAIHVLHQHRPRQPVNLEHVHWLECARANATAYHVDLSGGPAPPSAEPRSKRSRTDA